MNPFVSLKTGLSFSLLSVGLTFYFHSTLSGFSICFYSLFDYLFYGKNREFQLNCPLCRTELLGQENYSLKRCDRCRLWFEVEAGELVPLQVETTRFRR